MSALQGLAAAAFATGGIDAGAQGVRGGDDRFREQARYWLALGSLELQAGAYEQAESAFANAAKHASGDRRARTRSTRWRVSPRRSCGSTSSTRRRRAASGCSRPRPGARSRSCWRRRRRQAVAIWCVRANCWRRSSAPIRRTCRRGRCWGSSTCNRAIWGRPRCTWRFVVSRQPDNIRAQQLLAEVRSRLQSPEETLESLKPTLDAAAGRSVTADAGEPAQHAERQSRRGARLPGAGRRLDAAKDARKRSSRSRAVTWRRANSTARSNCSRRCRPTGRLAAA